MALADPRLHERGKIDEPYYDVNQEIALIAVYLLKKDCLDVKLEF